MEIIFESERINFVQVDESLVNDYLILMNDFENVGRFIGNHHNPFTCENEYKWIKEKLEDNSPVFSMIEKRTNKFIGNIELMNLVNDTAELGIAITASMQEKGYGTEAIMSLIKYGKDILKLNHIILRTNINNLRAQHVYIKCGFKEYKRDNERIYMELK